ncbi:MAG: hypothetical protein Faunusvirus1_62 [Faunusvirus sp.]|uniref:Uncharacterized protein n=1 Tax=Faunusvirus sp. TaxID=2487766 RepID=A0A3G4ZVW2_9VIRU|nr:MAG: hypothetical protein Faunusvirus1_62 [Faunusvirus sp.]
MTPSHDINKYIFIKYVSCDGVARCAHRETFT